MKKIFILLTTMIAVAVYSAPVGKDTAESAAKNWLSFRNPSGSYGNVSAYVNIGDAVHAFNFQDGGFALIAADDASIPVLGYSETGYFSNDEEKTNLNFWIGLYTKAVKEIREKKLSNEETLSEWDDLLKGTIEKKGTKAVAPLLTSTWNQSPIYNMYCPLDGGSLSVVGCVATAMSQIMYYHKYPATGKSSSSYSTLGQLLSVDYYLSRYNWDLMTDYISGGSSSEAKHEVAQISYHAGVSVEMMYGSDGSGAYSEDVPYALKTYFKYNNAVSHNYRSAYNATTWRAMLQDQLDNARPVYYSGQGPDGGHAFVCDGYQDSDYYHFNWGWGGSADGYYSIDNLNPGGMTFNDYQAVVKDIIPKTSDIVLNVPIPDIQTDENSYVIDLSEHFTSTLGDVITYTIDGTSNINGLTYTIEGSILTLNKIDPGVSNIIVTCSTRNDNNFDEFYIQFGSGSQMAAFGKAYDFSGKAYMDSGELTNLNSMEKITFSTWMKLNSVGIEQGIMSKSSSTNTGWYMIIQSNNLLKFSVKTQDGITRRIYSITPLEADKWYHIDAVFDGKDLFIYLNGELDNFKDTYTATSSILSDNAASFKLGISNGTYLNGILDETILWNNPIGLEEIRSLMKQRPDISYSMELYWPFSEGFYDYTNDLVNSEVGTFISGDMSYWTDSEAPLIFFAEENSDLSSILVGDYDEAAVYTITSLPSSGSAVIDDSSTGSFTYSPSTDFTGQDEFMYTVTYGTVTTPEKTVIINVKEATGIENSSNISEGFELYGNYPNPFNPETAVSFSLDRDMNIILTVFDMTGRTVRKLAEGFTKAGSHSVLWDGKDDAGRSLSSGIYFFRLNSDTGSGKITKAMMLK